MFWKFDRLARDNDHAVMIKMLLRHEYGLKLYCVEGFSEDDDDSPYAALMEQMLACFAAFYSRNLSSETKRGKLQRATTGLFNGSIAPLGYHLVKIKDATDNRPAGLYVDYRAAAIVRRAFRLYSSAKYSDGDIAEFMNGWRYIKQLRSGKQPINKEMVRDMLQNRIYTGRTRHTDTVYKGTLGERRTSKRNRSEWFEGKHYPIITDELFEECQRVRAGLVRHKNSPDTERVYVLHDRVYCARCIADKPVGLVDDNYGRMRAKYHMQRGYAHYRCLAHERGYERCEQPAVPIPEIDAKLVEVLANLVIPDGFRQRVESAVKNRVENEAALKRIEDLNAIVERIDFRWEQGFITQDEYVEKRRQLQQEIKSLVPIDYEELIEAADLLGSFRAYWDACSKMPQPEVARQQLVAKIVDRIFVHESDILGFVLHGDFAVVLGEDETQAIEFREAISRNLEEEKVATNESSHFGDDGYCLPAGNILFSPSNANYQPLIRHLLQQLDLSLNTPLVRQPHRTHSTPKRKQKTA